MNVANTDNVKAARANYTAGAILSGSTSNTLPTSASATPSGTWVDWGYVSADGFVRTIERNSTKILDMNGDPILVVTESHSLSFKFKPAEINAEALKATLGDSNVTVGTGGAITGYQIKSDELTPRSYIFNLRLSDNSLMRVCIPKGSISATGDETLKPNELMTSEITLECLPNSNGIKAYVYFGTESSSNNS